MGSSFLTSLQVTNLTSERRVDALLTSFNSATVSSSFSANTFWLNSKCCFCLSRNAMRASKCCFSLY